MNGQNYGWANALADIGSAIIKKNALDDGVNKGMAYLNGLGEKEKTLNQLAQESANIQNWNDYNQKYLGVKNEYDTAQTNGQLTPEMGSGIIARSHALRNQAAAAGITLPGEELSANDMRVGLFDEGRQRVTGLTQGLLNAGYTQAGQFAPQSDMGRDAGAAAQPAPFDFGNSMAGINNLISQERGLFTDPNALKLKMLTDITKMNLSPEALAKVSPLVDSRIDSQKQSQLRNLYTQLAQVGNNREAARPILIEMARLGVNVPENLLPSKPDWRFTTAPNGTLLRVDGNTGQVAAMGNYAKPDADWITGFAPDGTPYKANKRTGEVIYGQQGQYAKPNKPGTVKDNTIAAAQQVAKNHNGWVSANSNAIAAGQLKESDSPWYKYLGPAQETIARAMGIQSGGQQNTGVAPSGDYNAIIEDLWNSKTSEERQVKYQQYLPTLKQFEAAGYNVANDLEYIKRGG